MQGEKTAYANVVNIVAVFSRRKTRNTEDAIKQLKSYLFSWQGK